MKDENKLTKAIKIDLITYINDKTEADNPLNSAYTSSFSAKSIYYSSNESHCRIGHEIS
jgi:hypothetical protein